MMNLIKIVLLKLGFFIVSDNRIMIDLDVLSKLEECSRLSRILYSNDRSIKYMYDSHLNHCATGLMPFTEHKLSIIFSEADNYIYVIFENSKILKSIKCNVDVFEQEFKNEIRDIKLSKLIN